MSRQKAGLRKEHDLASEIYELTGGSVIPLRPGWSGNQAVPSPDLLIPLDGSLRAVELKTSGQKRLVVSQEDVQDICDWAMDMNEIPTYPYLTIKFTRYEAQTMRLYKPWDIEESFRIIDETSEFDTNVTRSGNLSFGHPTHYDCDITSAVKSTSDGAAVLRDLYNDNPDGKKDKIGVDTILREHPDYWKF